MCALAAAATLLAGCGGSPQELRTSTQARKFLADVATGGKPSDWKPAGDAAQDAVRAWAVRDMVERIGAKLRDEGPEWACETAEQVERAHKLIAGIDIVLADEDRAEILASAQTHGADPTDAQALIDDALDLTGAELVETVAAACSAAEQL
jgi:hypothetical protein